MNSSSLVIIDFPTSCRIYYETRRFNSPSIACSHGLEKLISVHSGCGNRNSIDWVACKQQIFISVSSELREVQDQGTCSI